MQEEIEIDGTEISGTLHYVEGYTGFSGDPAEQEGNYLALHFAANDPTAEISVELIGGTVGNPKKLDDDGLCIFRISNKDTQLIRVYAESDNGTVVKTYSLSGLTLEEE